MVIHHFDIQRAICPFRPFKADSPLIIHSDAVLPLSIAFQDGQDFLLLNPKGYVPALCLDNGQILTEGPAIVQYLADQKPASRFAPSAGTMERYRLQEWLSFLGTELHKSFSPLFNQASSDDAKRAAKENITKRFTYLDQKLAGSKYLMGETFTVADAYAFTIVNWANFVGIDLKPYPNLSAYLGRIGARPKVQEALKAEGLL